MKKILLLLIPFLLAGCLQTVSPENKKPNVIIILSDDQGWGDLSV